MVPYQKRHGLNPRKTSPISPFVMTLFMVVVLYQKEIQVYRLLWFRGWVGQRPDRGKGARPCLLRSSSFDSICQVKCKRSPYYSWSLCNFPKTIIFLLSKLLSNSYFLFSNKRVYLSCSGNFFQEI